MAQAGVSTLGVLAGYAIETTEGVKPTEFIQLTRVASIGGVNLEVEQLDASTLEDLVTRYIAGRQDTGGSIPVTINVTRDNKAGTIKQWQDAISAYNRAKAEGKRAWFEVYVPDFDVAWFSVVQFPQIFGQPEFNGNEVLQLEIGLTLEEYIGLDDAIEPTPAS